MFFNFAIKSQFAALLKLKAICEKERGKIKFNFPRIVKIVSVSRILYPLFLHISQQIGQ